MLFTFLKKQTNTLNKKNLTKAMFLKLHIPEEQKQLYIEALEILDEEWVNRLYEAVTNFVEKVEMKQMWEIQDKKYAKVDGLRKKEALERQQEINSFNLLIDKL